MFGRLIRRFVGTYCDAHDLWFRSDFCPPCVRAREVRADIQDTRPAWHESDTTWRKKNRVAAIETIVAED